MVDQILYDMIAQAIFPEKFDEEKLMLGIRTYSEENGFEQFVGQFSDEVLYNVLLKRVSTITCSGPSFTRAYFENYDLVTSFTLITNRALKIAQRKYLEGSVDTVELDKAEDSLTKVLPKIYTISELRQFYAEKLSECVLDLDYARGKTDKMSQRLAAKICIDSKNI